jgi:hypothetical protein
MQLSLNQLKTWQMLNQAIDDAKEQIPCTNYPELFFPDKADGESAGQAKRLCRSCPVLAQCGIYGIQFERYGVWGGLTPVERRAIRKARGISDPVAAESVTETFDRPVDPLFGADFADPI